MTEREKAQVGVPCRVLREITEEDKRRYPVYNG